MREGAGLAGAEPSGQHRVLPGFTPPKETASLVPRPDPQPQLLPEMTTRPGSECRCCLGPLVALGDSGETCRLHPRLGLLSASALMTWSFPSVLPGPGQLCDGLPAHIRAAAHETSHTLCTGHCVPGPADRWLLPCDRAPRAAESHGGP